KSRRDLIESPRSRNFGETWGTPDLDRGQPDAGLLDLLPRLSQRDVHIQLSFSPDNCDFHRVSGAVVVHDLSEVLLIFDLLVVNGHDDVTAEHDRRVAEVSPLRAGAESRLVGRAARSYLDNEQPV